LTVSGTYDQTTFNVDDIIRRACLRLRIPSAAITAELAQTAKDDLWLFMQTVTRSGLPLWTVEKIILPIYWGRYRYELPSRIVDKLGDPSLRVVSRADDSTLATSSAGGTIAYAFDGELTNIFLQTSTLGNVVYDFGTDFSLSMVGYLPAATSSTLALIWEASDDNSTWVTVVPNEVIDAVSGEWCLRDVTDVTARRYWRVRATVGTINCYQLLFGFNNSDLPMGDLNRDDYLNQPNKAFMGRPLSYWWDRQRDAPVIHLWPVPNLNFMSIIFNARRRLMDVGALTNTLDFPLRWLEAVVDNLALRLTKSGVQHGLTDPVSYQLLVTDAQTGLHKAMGMEEDHAPFRIQPSIRRYTR